MRIGLISFTATGRMLEEKLVQMLREEGYDVDAAVKGAFFSDSISDSVTEWAGRGFENRDALIFIGAVGIAVRAIAPYIRSKTSDAAVLVLDEKGTYCIPVLSGHIGGANELALYISRRLPAIPVITTATDIERKWAVDVFAVKNGLVIENMVKAKQISARLLAGERILLCADTGDITFSDKCPDFLEIRKDEEPGKRADIYVGISRRKAAEDTLVLIPRAVTVGIGCRRGTKEEVIDRAVKNILDKEDIFPQSIQQVSSIDLKADEKGLKEYCERRSLPFVHYSTQELQAVCGTFSSSEFVEKTTGVGNVCERSAVCACGGSLLVKKQVHEGVTVAMAVRKWGLYF